MTKEMHTIILEAALAILRLKSDDELTEITPSLTRDMVQWCFENPVFPDTELETAMANIIKKFG